MFVDLTIVSSTMQYAQEPGVRLARLGTGNLWKDVLKVLPQDRLAMDKILISHD